jgi:hypothetical protein
MGEFTLAIVTLIYSFIDFNLAILISNNNLTKSLSLLFTKCKAYLFLENIFLQ